ncbi:hypothetical protein WR25_03270 isoform A [Diploscapter pachys]|uniref:Uncharacterized protein n=3 Tax=Diploscapter pachys TaxID=2018661 RepID=A0A2A2JQE8_9BILA|nr:hypothetical protein WR25_03270 isoform A [Diploscapter pachys]
MKSSYLFQVDDGFAKDLRIENGPVNAAIGMTPRRKKKNEEKAQVLEEKPKPDDPMKVEEDVQLSEMNAMVFSMTKKKKKKSREQTEQMEGNEDNAEGIEASTSQVIDMDDDDNQSVKSVSSSTGFGHVSPFANYNKGTWSPAFLFYHRSDVMASKIRTSGCEGLGRNQIGAQFNYSSFKPGTSRSTRVIQNLLDERKEHFSQYQKTHGKLRSIKFYWTLAGAPEIYENLIKQFHAITGLKFPYKMTETIKFPGQNLNTLRISEVSIRRIVWIVEKLQERPIILPFHMIVNHMRDKEKALNYNFEMDKKSALKCALVLKGMKLCNLYTKLVSQAETAENAGRKAQKLLQLQILTRPDISENSPKIEQEIENVKEQMRLEGRLWPNGAKTLAKKPKEIKERKKKKKPEPESAEENGEEKEKKVNARRRSSRRIKVMKMEEVAKQVADLATQDQVNEELDTDEEAEKKKKKQRKRKKVDGDATTTTMTAIPQGRNQVDMLKRLGVSVTELSNLSIPIPKTENDGNAERDQQSISVKIMKSNPKKRRRSKKQLDKSSQSKFVSLQNVEHSNLKSKRRRKDMIDLQSEANRVHMRSRFSSKERDFLVLIRAVGFFLNPIYRFWLDPKVMRDIMHEHVPEARTKTVTSLMAAGVREITRNNRMEFLQRIVKNLATFPDMRNLRLALAQIDPENEEEKAEFFKKAFEIANKLLFLDSQSMPPYNVSDREFQDYLDRENYVIAFDKSNAKRAMSKSKPPTDLDEINTRVASNLLMAILIDPSEGGVNDDLLQQMSAGVMTKALSILRSDGIVAKMKILNPATNQKVHTAHISFYFRHFFTHRFHPSLIAETWAYLVGAEESFGLPRVIEGDSPGELILALTAFSRPENALKVQVDGEIIQTIKSFTDETSATKQVRSLENQDLQLNKVDVAHTMNDMGPEVPSPEDMVQILDHSQPANIPVEEWKKTLRLYDIDDQDNVAAIFTVIQHYQVFGAKLADILTATELSKEVVEILLKQMHSTGQIVQVGVDERRWILLKYAEAWTVIIGDKRIAPRPWINAAGTICIATVRWLSEAILMYIVGRPGIKIEDLNFQFETALQRVCIEELIEMLVAAECINIVEEELPDLVVQSPFECEILKILFNFRKI